RCTTAAEEIFRAIAKTISKYQDKVYLSKEENDRLQRLIDVILKPEIKRERQFSCSDCGERFTLMGKLNSHRIMIPSGKNPYRCDECGKCFVQRGALDSHMRVHTGLNLHRCRDCGKGFVYVRGLNSHWKIHTKEKLKGCHITE
ncbi:unnamed protein product, partial [Coregonus sp. 'balchen']